MMPRVSVDEVRKLAPVEPSSVDETSKDGGAILSAPVQRIKVMLAIDGLGLGGSEVVVRALARTSIRSRGERFAKRVRRRASQALTRAPSTRRG
jgi:hypothetical protein